MQTEFLRSIGQTCIENGTSAKSDDTILSQSMSSAEASLAKTSALETQERRKDSTVFVLDCSSKPFAWLKKCSQILSSWKTSQRSLHGGFIEFSGPWPKSGMMQNGSVFAAKPLDARTKESDFFSLPTPAARDGKDLSRTVAYLSQRKRHTPSIVTELLTHGVPWFEVVEHVEAAMGFPLQWTDVGCMGLETPSCHRLQNGSDNE